MNNRIIVAMSGGVDSSVVAAMLAEQGYDVVGISMRLYATENADTKSCCSPDDLYDARRIAEQMGFPFYIVNYQREFQSMVVDYFVNEYKMGRTPSPCVACNNHLKFSTLLSQMKKLNGSKLATGHYARIVNNNNTYELHRGADPRKDQSYYLFGINKSELANIDFPLGNMNKHETRAIASRLNLITADKPDSQNLCFVGKGGYKAVVDKYLNEDLSGSIMHILTNEQLGTHSGIHAYTIGQRRGLNISYNEPLFVIKIDPVTNTVYVGPRHMLNQNTVYVDSVNWLIDVESDMVFSCQGQYVSQGAAHECNVTVTTTGFTVNFLNPQKNLSPGQAFVLYNGTRVLGGGYISYSE